MSLSLTCIVWGFFVLVRIPISKDLFVFTTTTNMFAQQYLVRSAAAVASGQNKALCLRSFSIVFQTLDSAASPTLRKKERMSYHATDLKRDLHLRMQPYEYAENEELKFAPHSPPLLDEAYFSKSIKSRYSASKAGDMDDSTGKTKPFWVSG
jgi:hypothetical protein